jgi:hypothetical protein
VGITSEDGRMAGAEEAGVRPGANPQRTDQSSPPALHCLLLSLLGRNNIFLLKHINLLSVRSPHSFLCSLQQEAEAGALPHLFSWPVLLFCELLGLRDALQGWLYSTAMQEGPCLHSGRKDHVADPYWAGLRALWQVSSGCSG